MWTKFRFKRLKSSVVGNISCVVWLEMLPEKRFLEISELMQMHMHLFCLHQVLQDLSTFYAVVKSDNLTTAYEKKHSTFWWGFLDRFPSKNILRETQTAVYKWCSDKRVSCGCEWYTFKLRPSFFYISDSTQKTLRMLCYYTVFWLFWLLKFWGWIILLF